MKQTEAVKDHGGAMQRPGKVESDNDKAIDLRSADSVERDAKLITSVEGRLANLHKITSPQNDPVVDEDENDVTDELTPDDDADTERDAGAAPDEATTSEDNGEEKEDETSEYKLPDAYLRTAIAFGWKEEEVRDMFQANPERALSTLSNLYQSRNKANAIYSDIGRREAERLRSQEQVNNSDGNVPIIDTAKLKEQYGEDAAPLIDVIEAQNKAMREVLGRGNKQDAGNSYANLPTEHQQRSAIDESTVETNIYSFFQSDSLKPYEKIYGKLGLGETWEDLSPGQRANRAKVLSVANDIAGGARLHGKELSLTEALDSAHMLVTQKYRDQILVEGIQKQVAKRKSGITLKPSMSKAKHGGDTLDEPKPGTRTREQLESAITAKMNKIFR